jgi:hypothetical protein
MANFVNNRNAIRPAAPHKIKVLFQNDTYFFEEKSFSQFLVDWGV